MWNSHFSLGLGRGSLAAWVCSSDVSVDPNLGFQIQKLCEWWICGFRSCLGHVCSGSLCWWLLCWVPLPCFYLSNIDELCELGHVCHLAFLPLQFPLSDEEKKKYQYDWTQLRWNELPYEGIIMMVITHGRWWLAINHANIIKHCQFSSMLRVAVRWFVSCSGKMILCG